MNFTEKMKAYVIEYTGQNDISEDENLFEAGLLTSLDVLDLIDYIESEFDLELDEDDIGMEYLGTIEGMGRLIQKYKD